jgi:uncharacterized protein YndB with AHSA1/START domain
VPAPFSFDRRWRFDVAAAELWAAVSRVEEFPRVWSWLDRFDAEGLYPGATARFSVRPPLPYRLNVTVEVAEVEPERLVVVSIGGDVAGPARLEITPLGDGASQARLTWTLELKRPALVRLDRVARPAMVWGHDTVVGMGVRQFRRRALAATPPSR